MGIKSKNYNFSTIMPIFNVEEYLDESIESILNQTLNFEDNIQLIIIDDGSTDNSKNIALYYKENYPDNIVVLSKEKGGVSSARNLGLEYATGKYINFVDPDDLVSNDMYEKVYKFFLKNPSDDYDVVAVPIEFFESWTGEHPLNYKFHECKSDFVDLYKFDYFISTIVAFIKKDAIGKLKFDVRLSHMEDALFVNKIILKKMKFGLVKNVTYYYRKRYSKSSLTNMSTYKKEFFTDRFKYGYLELINTSINLLGIVPKFLQNYFVYDLRWLVEIPNFKEQINEVFSDKSEIVEFYSYFDKILSFIDIDVIQNHVLNPDDVKNFLIYLKNKDFHIETDSNKVFLKSNDIMLNKLHNHYLWLDIIDLNEGYLNISGTYSSFCDNKYIKIIAIKNCNGIQEIFDSKYYDYSKTYRKTKELLSIPWKFYYNFDFKIPVNSDEVCNILFKIIYEEDNVKVCMSGKLKFRYYADLSRDSPYSVRNNQILHVKNNLLFIEQYSNLKFLKNELKNIFNIFKIHSKGFLPVIFYRIIYLLLYFFMKNKSIWIFMDRQDSSGDNGEHLFEYSIEQDDKTIDKYFAINKDSLNYSSLKESYGSKIIPFGSFKHKLLYLFANKIISSHPDSFVLNPFYENNNLRLISGLITSKIYFLQHGVPKYEMSSWLTKYNRNLSLILAVSNLDYNSYIGYYNYDENIIQLLGYPRFDNLNNDNLKNQIMIMFSWRHNIKDEKSFINSELCSKINSLINNDVLINCAKTNGYEIIFKSHPNIVKYEHLLDKNEYVTFDKSSKIHDLICDSSLMITDYSSVAFDFAYLEKPVMYYHYGEDYHFDVETCFFDEKLDGFGEVIVNEDELVNKIVYYIENGCLMENKFKKNVYKFFKFHDKNNSKRVYEWIKNN